MLKHRLVLFILSMPVVIFSPSIFAHATHVHANSFISGIGHPVLGLDHLLAMLAVGIISTLLGGKEIWRVPAIFLFFMLLGATLGSFYRHIEWVEYGIVASVISLGIIIALGKNSLSIVTFFFIALFGLFHGYAHGAEMPTMVEPLLYGLGFTAGTTALHICGVLIGFIMDKIPRGGEILRLLGSAMSAVGVYFFIGLLLF